MIRFKVIFVESQKGVEILYTGVNALLALNTRYVDKHKPFTILTNNGNLTFCSVRVGMVLIFSSGVGRGLGLVLGFGSRLRIWFL